MNSLWQRAQVVVFMVSVHSLVVSWLRSSGIPLRSIRLVYRSGSAYSACVVRLLFNADEFLIAGEQHREDVFI
jgi:hypothetical protein